MQGLAAITIRIELWRLTAVGFPIVAYDPDFYALDPSIELRSVNGKLHHAIKSIADCYGETLRVQLFRGKELSSLRPRCERGGANVGHLFSRSVRMDLLTGSVPLIVQLSECSHRTHAPCVGARGPNYGRLLIQWPKVIFLIAIIVRSFELSSAPRALPFTGGR